MVKFSLIRLNITNWRINGIVIFWLIRPNITNWPINPLKGSILEQNDLGLREIFSKVNCGHFGKKIESVRPSCQKLFFCPY